MTAHPDVLILGGGVIGLTAAYFLAGDGASVSLLDRADLGQQASWAGAGILPPADPSSAHTPVERLLALSNSLYPGLSQELRERTGIDNGFLVCGGVEVPTEGPTEWHGEGTRSVVLDRHGLSALAPDLADFVTRAYHLPDLAQLRNPRHLRALIAGCALRGVRLVPGCAARGFQKEGGRVDAVETEQGPFHAGKFLVAAGAWSDELLGELGWRPGIRPVRGQIALLNTDRPGVRPVLLHGKRYLVPRPDGRWLIGSTEEEAGFDARPTAGGIAGLLAFGSGLVPVLAEAHLERCWAGLRPGSPDGLPYLGPVPGWENVFVAAGHFRAGIQLSPGTARVMTDLLSGRAPAVPMDAFRLDRRVQ
jgi:glycine oxidase